METPSKTLAELNADLHKGLAEELLSRLQHGEATTQDLNVIRQFLKDNGVTGALQEDGKESPLGELAKILPFPKAKVA